VRLLIQMILMVVSIFLKMKTKVMLCNLSNKI